MSILLPRACKPFLLVSAATVLLANASGCGGCKGGNVKGKVIDQDGNPIKGVSVMVLGKTDTTDGKGKFEIKRIADFPKKRVVAYFDKEGYFDYVGGARVTDGDVFIAVGMSKRELVGDVDNSSGGTIQHDGITAHFNPRQWMNQNGEEVVGRVNIYAARVNPDRANFPELMPGRDFNALGDNSDGALTSAGAIIIEAEDEDGNPVDLLGGGDADSPIVIEDGDSADIPTDTSNPWDTDPPGGTDTSSTNPGDSGTSDTGTITDIEDVPAYICLDIPATMLGVAPDTIPLWQLGSGGIWEERGIATRIEDQFCFVMNGTGSLNCDLFSRTALVQGTVCNRKGEPVGEGRAVDVFQNSAYTDSAGQYAALVPACYSFDVTARGESVAVAGIAEGKTRTVNIGCDEDTGAPPSSGTDAYNPFGSTSSSGSSTDDGTSSSNPFGGSSSGGSSSSSSDPVVIEDGSGASSPTDTGSFSFDTGPSTWDTGTSTSAPVADDVCTSGDDAMIQQAAAAPVPVACDSAGVSGSDTPWTGQVEMNQTSGTFDFTYNTKTLEDRIIVSYEGTLLFDTGCVGATDTVPLSYSGTTTTITVSTMPNCAGGSGTAWDFGATCP